MVILSLQSGLPAHLRKYASGETNNYPNVVGVKPKTVKMMVRRRREFIRNLLARNHKAAHQLPDFNELMAVEIFHYAKNTLRPYLFKNWDEVIRETPHFCNLFNRESARLSRDYQDATENNRPFIKHRYLSITAKRRAFAAAIADKHLLAELELACFGEIHFGLLDE